MQTPLLCVFCVYIWTIKTTSGAPQILRLLSSLDCLPCHYHPPFEVLLPSCEEHPAAKQSGGRCGGTDATIGHTLHFLWVPLHRRIPSPRPRETLKGTLCNRDSLSLVGYSRTAFKTRLVFLLWYESVSPTSGAAKTWSLDQIRLSLLKTLMKGKPQAAIRTEAIPWLLSALEAALSLQCRHGFCGSEVNTWEDYWRYTAYRWSRRELEEDLCLYLPSR